MVRGEESSQQPDETPSEQSVEKLDENPRRHDPLLVAAAAAVSLTLVALVAIAGAAYANHWEGFWRGMGQPYATTLAALAAVSAGAIALHNSRSQLEELRAQRTQDQTRWEQQREQDQERWEDQRKRDASKDLRSRFSEITTQLADTSPTVRRSGAYAMAALANDWRSIGEEAEMKVCFGVLAAYLTTPNLAYTDEPKPNAGDDGPVRALIVALLSRNAGSGLEDLWGSSSLLSGADLRGVSFNAPVNRVDFSDADLTGATFTKSDFKGARFLSANLSKASLTYLDLQGAQLSFAKLMETDLYRADLRKAQLDHAELLGADLDDAMLAGASMMYADLRGVDLSRTVLDGVRLEGVDYDDETKWPDGFTPAPKLAWQ
ncbi:pentapeptide repeat-containing protein [Mycobacterium colombiense]|uniref:pentapeptide repeat-containing protein n=1 Tax=Mycobacterium colombiense TaxID=339268 RepID=UPI0009BD498B|nr:pentapeptide repeat-containing protein [Mycobacterium colombiense]